MCGAMGHVGFTFRKRTCALHYLMSGLGQKRTCAAQLAMSAKGQRRTSDALTTTPEKHLAFVRFPKVIPSLLNRCGSSSRTFLGCARQELSSLRQASGQL